MGQFSYRGRDADGSLVEGVLEAADSSAVATQLFATGVTPVRIDETDDRSDANTDNLISRLTRRKVGQEDLLLFSRQMYTLLKAGVPIMRALGGLQESTTNPAFRETLRAIRENLDAGQDVEGDGVGPVIGCGLDTMCFREV